MYRDERLKTEYPVLAEYDALLQQRKHLTGYYREKTDKKMQEMTKSLMINKTLLARIKQVSPKIAGQIIKQGKHYSGLDLGLHICD